MNRQLAFALTALVLLLAGVTWNGAYEAVPAGTDLASDLDTFIQSFKTEVRQHLEVEHIFGGSTDDNGLHSMGSARVFIQNTTPTAINNGTAALGQYNSSAGADGGTALTTDEIGPTTRDIGAGRLWVDLDGLDTGTTSVRDDRRLTVWNETTNSFANVVAIDPNSIGIASMTLVDSFDATSGDGSTASTTAPLGWTNLNTATIGYVDPTAVTEGEGVVLRTTAAGGANEGVTRTFPNLRAGAIYVVRVRVRAAAGDTCNLNVTDGATSETDTTTTTAAFENLEVQQITTAAPATVTVNLRATADTDVCDWDHFTMYEASSTIRQIPTAMVMQDVDIVGSGVGVLPYIVPNVSLTYTVPRNAVSLTVNGHSLIGCNGGDSTTFGIYTVINGGAPAACANGFHISTAAGAHVQSLNCLIQNPTPGDQYVFTWRFTTESGTCSVNEETGGTDRGETRLILTALPQA